MNSSRAASPPDDFISLTIPSDPATPPRLPLTWWGITVRGVVAVVIVLGATFIPLGLMLVAGISDQPVVAGLQRFGLSAINCVLAFLAVWAWMRYAERRPFAATGFGGTKVVTGLVAGTVAAGALVLLAHLIGIALGMASGEMPEEFPSESAAVIIGAVFELAGFAFLLQGIPEELVFRGWLLRSTPGRPWLGFWWSTGVFTVMHLLSQAGQEGIVDHLLYLVTSFGIAVFAAVCAMRWGNGWIAAGIHSGFHVGTLIATYTLPPIEPRVMWVLPGVLFTIAAGALLRGATRRAAVLLSRA